MEASLDYRFWLLLIMGLPAAIYYSTKLYYRFKHKRPKGKSIDSIVTGTGRILEIVQQEPSNRPPLILSIVLGVCSLLILTFGSFVLYLWISGRVASRIDGSTILFLLLFVCAPIAVLVDIFFLQPRAYRLGCIFRSKPDSIPGQSGHPTGRKRTPYRTKADSTRMKR